MSLNKSQKATLAEFKSVTSCPDKQATEILRNYEWSLSEAIDAYFEGAGSTAPPPASSSSGSNSSAKAAASAAESKVDACFKQFEDPADPGKITADGIEKLCDALGIDMYSDVAVLLLAYAMKAQYMGEFTKAEWATGLGALGVDSVPGLKAKLPTLRAELAMPAKFAKFFAWCYDFNCDEGQKSIKLETAVAVLPMLISSERWPLIDAFVAFLSRPGARTVSKDTWVMLLDFIRTVNAKLTNFDEDAAWPVAIDDFVQWARDNKRV